MESAPTTETYRFNGRECLTLTVGARSSRSRASLHATYRLAIESCLVEGFQQFVSQVAAQELVTL